MKRKDLIRRLEEMGCVLVRHGGNHDWYNQPNDQEVATRTTPSLRRILLPMSALICLLALVDCSGSKPGTDGQETRPDDFSIEYHWKQGSLPPRYYYEYLINVEPNGDGKLVMFPSAPTSGGPKWVESFSVDPARLDSLYRMMAGNDLFSRAWRRADPHPVGGSRRSLVIAALGKRTTVEDYLVAGQQAPAGAIFAAVEGLAPKRLMDELLARREEYAKSHSTK